MDLNYFFNDKKDSLPYPFYHSQILNIGNKNVSIIIFFQGSLLKVILLRLNVASIVISLSYLPCSIPSPCFSLCPSPGYRDVGLPPKSLF